MVFHHLFFLLIATLCNNTLQVCISVKPFYQPLSTSYQLNGHDFFHFFVLLWFPQFDNEGCHSWWLCHSRLLVNKNNFQNTNKSSIHFSGLPNLTGREHYSQISLQFRVKVKLSYYLWSTHWFQLDVKDESLDLQGWDGKFSSKQYEARNVGAHSLAHSCHL